MTAAQLRGLAWIALPVGVHLAILSRLWFNAPVWDDFGTLAAVLWLQDVGSIGDRLEVFFRLHNEHRIALARFIAWTSTEATGRTDFRVLALVANLFPLGVLALAWAEFRHEVKPIALAAAAWLLYNWSYYEAALQSMVGLSNLGVIVAAFACLHFAMRDGRDNAAAAIGAGLVAAATMGNGLFALPIAAAGCALVGRRRRAALMALIAVALWLAYFHGYARPPHQPSPMVALSRPGETAALFLVVIGGIFSHVLVAKALGAAILAACAWLLWRGGLWRSHPAVVLWIAFMLLSAAAAAVGRVGWGVQPASRFAVQASVLLAILTLCFWAHARPSGRRAAVALVLAGTISAAATAAAWSKAKTYSFEGRLLAKAVPAVPGTSHDLHYGFLFPDPQFAADVLRPAEHRGIYVPQLVTVHPIAVRTLARPPDDARRFGVVDAVDLEGIRVRVRGWTDIDAREAGQLLAILSPDASPAAVSAASVGRTDVARVYGSERLLYSGFRLELEFATVEEAARASRTLCVFAQSPGRSMAALERANVACAGGK